MRKKLVWGRNGWVMAAGWLPFSMRREAAEHYRVLRPLLQSASVFVVISKFQRRVNEDPHRALTTEAKEGRNMAAAVDDENWQNLAERLGIPTTSVVVLALLALDLGIPFGTTTTTGYSLFGIKIRNLPSSREKKIPTFSSSDSIMRACRQRF